MPQARRQALGGRERGHTTENPFFFRHMSSFCSEDGVAEKRTVLSPLIMHYPWQDQLLLKQPRTPFTLPVGHLWDPWGFGHRCQAVTKLWWLSQDRTHRASLSSESACLLTVSCTVSLRLWPRDVKRQWDPKNGLSIPAQPTLFPSVNVPHPDTEICLLHLVPFLFSPGLLPSSSSSFLSSVHKSFNCGTVHALRTAVTNVFGLWPLKQSTVYRLWP